MKPPGTWWVVLLAAIAALSSASPAEPPPGYDSASEGSGDETGGDYPEGAARRPVECVSAAVEIVEYETCGASHCYQDRQLRVANLVIQFESDASQEPMLTCREGRVRFDHMGGVEIAISEIIAVGLSPEFERRLSEMERAKPGRKGALEAATAVSSGLDVIAYARVASGDPENPRPAHVVADGIVARAAMIQAREAFAMGDWVTADSIARGARKIQALEPDAEALLAKLAKARAASAPIAARRLHRIGTVASPPVLPPLSKPTVFWRGGSLCVLQDDGKGEMRCYDPAAEKWGSREPLAQPQGGLIERSVRAGPDGEFCVIASGENSSRGEEPSRGPWFCGHLPEESTALAMGPGPAFVFEVDHGLVALGKDRSEALSPKAASALLAAGAGGYVAGGGTLVLGPETGAVHRVGERTREWPLFPSAPPSKDRRWMAQAQLASPDQRFVVVVSDARLLEAGPMHFGLWLARLQPRSGPRR